MVECELTREDRVPSPKAGDGVAVTALTPNVAAPPVSAAGMLAQSRLLDSVAAFTRHRDVDALDHSLALSLAKLTSARSVLLGTRAADSSSHLESMVHCTPDAQGGYQLRVSRPG